MAGGVFTPYSTVSSLFGAKPGWVPAEETERILSYQIYEEIYWNHPETFKLVLRGTDAKPIYIPAGRIICETVARFTAKGLRFNVIGPDAEAATLAMDQLFAREKFRSKFKSIRDKAIRLGDGILHVIADGSKLPGARISLRSVDPASYFPVYDPNDLDRIVKVHLVEEFVDEDDKPRVKRQTYEKTETGAIISSAGVFETDKWSATENVPVRVITPPTQLDPRITAIPVYHFRNQYEEGNPYGSSEMRGLERLMAAMNQAISDEGLTLAMDGLGVYKTSSGAPLDDDGNETNWILGPGRVLENVEDFERVSGVTSTSPYGDHIARLWSFLKNTSGTPDAALGDVDVQVAESGVALALRLAPILSRAEDKTDEFADVLNQFFYDLKSWFAVYEAMTWAPETVITAVFKEPLPANKDKELERVITMMTSEPPLMSATSGREYLAQFGFYFAEDELVRLAQEAQLKADQALAADPFAARTDAELAGAEPTVDSTEGADGAP